MNIHDFFMKEKILGLEKMTVLSNTNNLYAYKIKDAYRRGKRNIFIIERTDGKRCLITNTTDRECGIEVVENFSCYESKVDPFGVILSLTLFQRLLKEEDDANRVTTILMFETEKMIALHRTKRVFKISMEETKEYGMCLICNLGINGKDKYFVVDKFLNRYICIGNKDPEYSKYSNKQSNNNTMISVDEIGVLYTIDKVDKIDFDGIKELDIQYEVD